MRAADDVIALVAVDVDAALDGDGDGGRLAFTLESEAALLAAALIVERHASAVFRLAVGARNAPDRAELLAALPARRALVIRNGKGRLAVEIGRADAAAAALIASRLAGMACDVQARPAD